MHDDAETITQPPRVPSQPLVRGATVGRYVVIDRLGAGAMGVVYRAFDPDLDRRVALKLVRTITAESTARMVREAQALAKVSHPNIVQVFDVGVHGDTVFITMELIEGETLAAWAKQPRPWRALLAHLIEAGRGLAAAHAVGLVHRDFKPANAIVGADGRVRVLDFGVARLADEPVASDDSLPSLRSSKLTGTPVYMAPEQQRPGLLDARADQFSFAVTCWELLHGERPFPGDNAKAYLAASCAGELRAAPANTKVPARVTRVLTRALATAPADRYRDMDALLAALSADPRRWRIGVALLAVAAAVWLIVHRTAPEPCQPVHLDGVWDAEVAIRLADAFRATGASIAGDTAEKATAALDARATAWTAMHQDACRATEVLGAQSPALLDLRMSCLARRREELRALVGELVAARDGARVAGAIDAIDRLPPIAACADRDALAAVVPLPDEPATRDAIAHARDELFEVTALDSTGQWPAARRRAEALQDRARAIGWSPLIAEAALARAQVERDAGGFVEAEQALGEVVPAAARAHLDGVGTTAWSELAWIVGYEEERPLEGLAFATAAEASALREGAGQDVIAGIANVRANLLAEKGDQDAALREAERAVALSDARERVTALNTLGMVRSNQADWPHAEIALREVLALRLAAEGDKHPHVADALDNLGVVLAHKGATAEARADYERALAIRIAALGPDHRDVGTSHNNLGGLLLDSGDLAGAEIHLTAALAIYEKALGKDHVDLAIPLTNLGELAIRRGDFARALADCRRALALDEHASADKLAPDLGCIGEAALGLRDYPTARPSLVQALDARDPDDLARFQRALVRTWLRL